MKIFFIFLILLVQNCCLYGKQHFNIDQRNYYVSKERMNWFAAQRHCTSNGYYLIDILDEDEHQRIENILDNEGKFI